jgi:hypothetical protein
MSIIDKVAEAVAEIPGRPSAHEIARIAIEEYQNQLWPSILTHSHQVFPELRWHRTNALVAQILHIIGKYLCEHGDIYGHKGACRDLTEALYEAGAEVITDADRRIAGLLPRDSHGLTVEELQILEFRRTEAMLKPIQGFVVDKSAQTYVR